MLLLPVLGLGLLIWLPALIEWLRPTDAAPLEIDQDYSRNDAHFADRFKLIASPWWSEKSPQALLLDTQELEAGGHFQRAVLAHRLKAGPDCRFASEVWIREAGYLSTRCQARAVLCEDALLLGANCHIERWVHAEGSLTVDEGCALGARATSARVISLGPRCRAQLISAAEIHWMSPPQAFPMPHRPWTQRWESFERSITGRGAEGTVFVDGDVVVDETARIDFPLVVRGSLYVRQGALLASDIKAHGDLWVERSEILGNLTALGKLVVGDGAVVQGCLRGDSGVWLGDRILLGRPHRLVAVVGSRINLSGCGTAYGRLKALEGWVEVSE